MQEASDVLSGRLKLAAVFGITLLILISILINGFTSQVVLYSSNPANQASSYFSSRIVSILYGGVSLAIWVCGVIFTKIINNITNDYWYPALLNFFNKKSI